MVYQLFVQILLRKQIFGLNLRSLSERWQSGNAAAC